MTRLRCDTCGDINDVRGPAPDERSLPDSNRCQHCGGQIVRPGGALWRPKPSRPAITRLCCVNCGVKTSIFQPTHNLCIGWGGGLFRPPQPKVGKAGRAMEVLWYGGWGIAILFAGVGWLLV